MSTEMEARIAKIKEAQELSKINEKLKKELEELAKDAKLEDLDLKRIGDLIKQPSWFALRLLLAIGEEKSATARWMAEVEYNAQFPAHSCYRNDRFCIAHLFNLDESKKRKAAPWIIENGMAGYFEPVTHDGYKLSEILYEMDALEKPITHKGYCFLKENTIRKIAETFKLTDQELSDCAENVIGWPLHEVYHVDIPYTISASSRIDLREAKILAGLYLTKEKREYMDGKFEQATRNATHGNWEEWKIDTGTPKPMF